MKNIKHKLKKTVRGMAYASVLGLAFASGCGVPGSQGVRGRLGCTPTIKMFRSTPDYRNLGTHNTVSEKKGQIYTCKGGFIDIAHLRKGADFANVYTKSFFDYLMEGKTEFSYKMKEPCTYHMKIKYPSNWQNTSEENKKKMLEDIAIQLGEYSSFLGTSWHEMLTFYGYKMTGIIPEYHSAFTIDDNFSNFLGARIAADVLKRNKQIFNTGTLQKDVFNRQFTIALRDELARLGALSSSGTTNAIRRANSNDRCLNVGLTGYVDGPLISGLSECSGNATQYPAPSLNISRYGFSAEVGIEPHDGAGKRMRRIAGKSELINPEKDFPAIMQQIKIDAERKGWRIVNW